MPFFGNKSAEGRTARLNSGTTQNAVTTSRLRPRISFKASLGKLVKGSKVFFDKVSSMVDSMGHRSLPNDGSSDSSPRVSSKTSISEASSMSTAPTEQSLPMPDYGAPFDIPEIQPSHDPERAGETSPKLAAMVPETSVVLRLDCLQAVRADSALGRQSLPEKTSEKDKLRDTHTKVMEQKDDRSECTRPEEQPATSSATSCSSSEEEDDEYPRCDFKTIMAIPDIKFTELVHAQCGSASTDIFSVTDRTRGAWNAVAMVSRTRADDNQTLQEYVVRVPAHGTPAHWTAEDGYMIEREAELLEYIHENTTAPVSEIIDFSTSHDNVIGYPYILMTKLPGQNAASIWFDQPYNPGCTNWAYRLADVPTTATEKKRVNFLRSLARHMTSIQELSFTEIGMPMIPDMDDPPIIGPHFHWKNDGSDEAIERLVAQSTQEYALDAMCAKLAEPIPDKVDATYLKAFGNRVIFNMIFLHPVFNSASPETETFTIHHDDLDLQNILVDEEGNVTGIIDWDKSFAAPRCIGAAAVPVFLRNDWYPRYTHDIRISPHMAWNYEHYREIYAAAMVEAGNSDAKYTLNSGLYQSCYAAITEGGDRYDLVEKLLHAFPHCRVDAADFQVALGSGWDSAKDMLEYRLGELLAPKLPREGLLAQLDNEIALNEWWLTFDHYLEVEQEDEEEEEENGNDDEYDDDDADDHSEGGSEDEPQADSDIESETGSS
jgi:hypothetical protein